MTTRAIPQSIHLPRTNPLTLRRTPASLLRDMTRVTDIAWNLFLIFTGCVICSWAVNAVLIPHDFLSGGLAGAALIIHYILPDTSVGLLYFLLNIPIFVLGRLYVGRRFFWYSTAGLLIFSGTIMFVKGPCSVTDKLLAALLGGIVSGVGGGLILRSMGSAGGTDILSIILLKKYSVKIGSTVLAFNACVLGASAFLFSIEAVLYTMISMYVCSRIVELMVSGLSQRKSVMIISPKWKKISGIIREELDREVTEIPSRGGHSRKQANILYTVVTFRELARLKEKVSRVDSSPFMVVSDTLEVMGRGIGNQPHW